MRFPFFALVSLISFAASAETTGAAGRDRREIPDRYKWNLAALYPSEQAWDTARASLAERVSKLSRFEGKLGASPAALYDALNEMAKVGNDLDRLYVYASARADEDTRQSRPLEMRQAAEQLYVAMGAATAYVEPELLAMDPAKLKGFVSSDKRLAPWSFFIDDTLRRRPHTLGAAEERVIAAASDLRNAGDSMYGLLVDADLPWPTVKLSSGQSVRLDQSAYELYRASKNKADRDVVFEAFYGALGQFERTLGAAMYATVKAQSFTRKVRKYDSNLEASLFPNAIPTQVYKQLLADVNKGLPTFHRYLALRQRMLGVKTMRYQDMYVPMVGSVELRYEPERAMEITLAAVAPLGKKYVETMAHGFKAGWTDFLPSTGKKSGAYSTGVYGVQPIQLLNYNGQYQDLSTLAHEAGHSMHTWLAYQAQPYPTSNYVTFVAEVASTLNENLLLHHMLDETKDDATRLALLGNYLDGAKGSLFRQAQFAEFELAAHEMAERGETITGENLSKLYLGITRKYYGHDRGVCRVDDLIAREWEFISHFHSPFYVYQYATSFVASTALARGILEEAKTGGTARRDAYLKMLAAGGSNYPIELLKVAGVDMTTSKPLDATLAEMNAVMDQMEAILAKMGR